VGAIVKTTIPYGVLFSEVTAVERGVIREIVRTGAIAQGVDAIRPISEAERGGHWSADLEPIPGGGRSWRPRLAP
jgi:hypothetical protein